MWGANIELPLVFDLTLFLMSFKAIENEAFVKI